MVVVVVVVVDIPIIFFYELRCLFTEREGIGV